MLGPVSRTELIYASSKYSWPPLSVIQAPATGTTVRIRQCSKWSDRDPKQLWRYDPTLFHILHLGQCCDFLLSFIIFNDAYLATNLYLNVPGNGDHLDLKEIASDVRQIWRTYK